MIPRPDQFIPVDSQLWNHLSEIGDCIEFTSNNVVMVCGTSYLPYAKFQYIFSYRCNETSFCHNAAHRGGIRYS